MVRGVEAEWRERYDELRGMLERKTDELELANAPTFPHPANTPCVISVHELGEMLFDALPSPDVLTTVPRRCPRADKQGDHAPHTHATRECESGGVKLRLA